MRLFGIVAVSTTAPYDLGFPGGYTIDLDAAAQGEVYMTALVPLESAERAEPILFPVLLTLAPRTLRLYPQIGVRGTPERDYVVPGCGRRGEGVGKPKFGVRRNVRIFAKMCAFGRVRSGGFLHERALQKSPRIVKHAFFGQNFGARQMQALK